MTDPHGHDLDLEHPMVDLDLGLTLHVEAGRDLDPPDLVDLDLVDLDLVDLDPVDLDPVSPDLRLRGRSP